MRSSVTDGDLRSDWEHWHEERVTQVAAPHGPLSLTGTHWLADHPDGRLPAVPGRWRDDGDAVLLSAAPEDGLTSTGRRSRARSVSPPTTCPSTGPGSPAGTGGSW